MFNHRFEYLEMDGHSKTRAVHRCVSCDGTWYYSAGRYHDARGDDPVECTEDLGQVHGEGDLFVQWNDECNCIDCGA